jgi:hypothetical protein
MHDGQRSMFMFMYIYIVKLRLLERIVSIASVYPFYR